MNVNRQRISAGLSSLGLVSSVSERISVGEYLPRDVEWNYKDVPHLKEVHNAVDSVLLSVSNEYAASLFMQKLGFLRIPLVVFVGADSNCGAVYVGAIGPFVLLIETTWSPIGVSKTKTVTKYLVFSKPLFRRLHFLVHRLLSRNYDRLMSEDLPMREQRGRLRKRGFGFVGDIEGYGFADTMNIYSQNVLAPQHKDNTRFGIPICSLPEGRSLIEGNTGLGLVVERGGPQITFFPRICDHEGADLGCSKRQGDALRCPWHGRLVAPLAVVDVETREIGKVVSGMSIEWVGDEIHIWQGDPGSYTSHDV